MLDILHAAVALAGKGETVNFRDMARSSIARQRPNNQQGSLLGESVIGHQAHRTGHQTTPAGPRGSVVTKIGTTGIVEAQLDAAAVPVIDDKRPPCTPVT